MQAFGAIVDAAKHGAVVPPGIRQLRRREAAPSPRRQSSGFSASARSPRFPTADATAIAVGSVGVAGCSARRRHDMDDAIAAAPSAHAGSSAGRRRCAPGCRAAAECLCPWPQGAASRGRRPAWRKRGASRRPENPRSRPAVPCALAYSSMPSLRGEAGDTEERRQRRAVVPSAAVTEAMPSSISCCGALDRQPVHAGADDSGCGSPPYGRHRAPCARLPDWPAPAGRPGRRSPSRIARPGFPESGCCISAAGRRRRSAPPRRSLERQRFAILHGADQGMRPGIDHQRARGAERIGMARAIGGEGGRAR